MLSLFINNPVTRFLLGLAAIVAFLGTFGLYWHHSGYQSGAKSVQVAFDLYKSQQAVIVTQEQAKNAAIETRSAQITAASSASYESQLAKLRKDNAQKTSIAYGIVCHDRVRVSYAPSGANAMPAISAATVSAHAVTADNVVTRQINELPESCTITTQQLVDLQDWINSVKNGTFPNQSP